MRGSLLTLGLLLVVVAPAMLPAGWAAGGTLVTPLLPPGLAGRPSFVAAGAGLGVYENHSNNGDFVCPLTSIAFTENGLGPTLVLRAGGAPDMGSPDPALVDVAPWCATGMHAVFSGTAFSGAPETGYRASRVTDHGQAAGVTTETLSISPLTQSPVTLDYTASTVGGPTPTQWSLRGILTETTYA
jgi:hypothetical protein